MWLNELAGQYSIVLRLRLIWLQVVHVQLRSADLSLRVPGEEPALF